MLQSIFNLDSFPLFFLVAGVGLVWGLNEGRKYFTHTPTAVQDASTLMHAQGLKTMRMRKFKLLPHLWWMPLLKLLSFS